MVCDQRPLPPHAPRLVAVLCSLCSTFFWMGFHHFDVACVDRGFTKEKEKRKSETVMPLKPLRNANAAFGVPSVLLCKDVPGARYDIQV